MKTIFKIMMVLMLVMGIATWIAAAATQFSRPEDAIKYRKSVMVIIATHFGGMGAMVKGAQPYDSNSFAENAATVDTLSALPWQAFLVPGSDRGDTTMNDKVLKDPDAFKKVAQEYLQATGNLRTAAEGNSLEAVKSPFGAVAASCKACHSRYRK
jgi:cytochrome c556